MSSTPRISTANSGDDSSYEVELKVDRNVYGDVGSLSDDDDDESSYEEGFFGEDEYQDMDKKGDDFSSSSSEDQADTQDVSELLSQLNQLETKVITQKGGDVKSTKHVLRQLSQLKVDLLTPSSDARSDASGRSRSSRSGRSVSSRKSGRSGSVGRSRSRHSTRSPQVRSQSSRSRSMPRRYTSSDGSVNGRRSSQSPITRPSGMVILDHSFHMEDDDNGSRSAGRRTRSSSAHSKRLRRGRKSEVLEEDFQNSQNSLHSFYSPQENDITPRNRGVSKTYSVDHETLDKMRKSTAMVQADNSSGDTELGFSPAASLNRSWHGRPSSASRSTGGSSRGTGKPRLGRPAKPGEFQPYSAGGLQQPRTSGSSGYSRRPSFGRASSSASLGRRSIHRSQSPSPIGRPEQYPGDPGSFREISVPNQSSMVVGYDNIEDESVGMTSGYLSYGGGRATQSVAAGNKSVVAAAREDRRQQAFEDKLLENDGYQPDLVMERPSGPPRMSTSIWDLISNLVTFPVHDACIRRQGAGAKKAWREKVTIFVIFLIASAAFVATVTVIPLLVCQESKEFYSTKQVGEKGWTSIHGKIYDMEDFANLHPGGSSTIQKYFGKDASKFFPRIPPIELPTYCLSEFLNETAYNETNSLGLQNVTCGYVSEEDQLLYSSAEGACHLNIVGSEGIAEHFEEFYEGELVIPGWDLGTRINMEYLLIDDLVYNVTSYIERLRVKGQLTLNPDHDTNENAYLAKALHVLVVNQRNQDASDIFHSLFPSREDKEAVK